LRQRRTALTLRAGRQAGVSKGGAASCFETGAREGAHPPQHEAD